MSFRVTVGGNSKLGGICGINLPAIITCPSNVPCRKGCYANKGHFVFKSVKQCYAENLNTFLTNPQQAEKDILSQLPLIGYSRLHASGDFVDEEYFKMIIRIAKKAKHVKFMAFSKRYDMINNYIAQGNKIPSNLKIIFSGWYGGWTFDNPYNLSVAYVYNPKENNEIPKNAKICKGKCQQCFICWNLKKGESVRFEKH